MPLARKLCSFAVGAAISLFVVAVPMIPRPAAEPVSALDAGARIDSPEEVNSPPVVEYVEYSSPYHPREQFLVGGLLAWMGVLAGCLAWIERRRVIGVSIGGGGLLIGLLLILGLGG